MCILFPQYDLIFVTYTAWSESDPRPLSENHAETSSCATPGEPASESAAALMLELLYISGLISPDSDICLFFLLQQSSPYPSADPYHWCTDGFTFRHLLRNSLLFQSVISSSVPRSRDRSVSRDLRQYTGRCFFLWWWFPAPLRRKAETGLYTGLPSPEENPSLPMLPSRISPMRSRERLSWNHLPRKSQRHLHLFPCLFSRISWSYLNQAALCCCPEYAE